MDHSPTTDLKSFLVTLVVDVADILDDAYRQQLPTLSNIRLVFGELTGDYIVTPGLLTSHIGDEDLRWEAIRDAINCAYVDGHLDLQTPSLSIATGER